VALRKVSRLPADEYIIAKSLADLDTSSEVASCWPASASPVANSPMRSSRIGAPFPLARIAQFTPIRGLWKTCQEPTLQTEVMTPHNTPLPRQNTSLRLALFLSGLGILIIGGKKFLPLLLDEKKAAPGAAFSFAAYNHGRYLRQLVTRHQLPAAACPARRRSRSHGFL